MVAFLFAWYSVAAASYAGSTAAVSIVNNTPKAASVTPSISYLTNDSSDETPVAAGANNTYTISNKGILLAQLENQKFVNKVKVIIHMI